MTPTLELINDTEVQIHGVGPVLSAPLNDLFEMQQLADALKYCEEFETYYQLDRLIWERHLWCKPCQHANPSLTDRYYRALDDAEHWKSMALWGGVGWLLTGIAWLFVDAVQRISR